MRKYQIQAESLPLPTLTDAVFDPDNCAFTKETPFAAIDQYVWPGEYRCEARSYVTRGEDHFNVLMCAKEEKIHTSAKKFGDSVCQDSCLEFFFRPVNADKRYLNFEVNAGGIMLIQIGPSREERTLLVQQPEGLNIQHSKHEGAWWAIRYTIPFAMIEALYGQAPDDVICGNFYTCDETIHPHFGTWNPVQSDHPDFHRPECFGELEFVTGK